ncbi:MAG: oligosaccharide flippase family protein [Hyphomicrobiaceae bacterium]|nr:oligosaccharide flippase family protein [Hyphomicrobiaceae bacterium]
MNAPIGRARAAFLLAYGDRLVVMLLTLATLLVTARLLSPREFGIAVLGNALIGLADVLRDFGGSAFVVQTSEASRDRLRTVFTVTFALTAIMAGGIWLASSPAEAFLGADGVGSVVRLGALTMLIGPFTTPVFSLLRRELDFATVARISIATSVVSSLATISFALAGFSYMSFAWANLLAAGFSLILCLYVRPMPGLYRPCLTEWRVVGAYGIYESARSVLFYLLDAAPHLALGRFQGAEVVGFFQRAQTVARLTERILLAGVSPALLPVLSEQARAGRNLKTAYLTGIAHVTVLIWPSLLVVIVLADPLVRLLLGSQWLETVPLVRILAGAYFLWFNMNLTNPLLISLGAIRDTFKLALFTVPVCILIQTFAARSGAEALAWSAYATVSIFVVTSLLIVHRHVGLSLRELGESLWRSLVIALMTAAGPALIVHFVSGAVPFGIPLLALCLGLAAAGWLTGLTLTRHPLLGFIIQALDRQSHRVIASSVLRRFERRERHSRE